MRSGRPLAVKKKWNPLPEPKRYCVTWQTQYGVDSIQFYDMNFFLREDQALELAERMAPLGLRWWCEARIDIVGSYSDKTLEAIRRAGCTMMFFGAESGSDWVLKEMNKQLTTSQTVELAARIKQFDIIPEFSFVIGNPKDPERDTEECLAFVRKIKRINPASEIIIYHYTPVPQRRADVWQRGRPSRIPHHSGRMGNTPLAELYVTH